MPRLTLDHGSIAYADSGTGDTVLLVHSSGNTRTQWRKLEQLLAPRYRVLAPDLFDYGESSAWGGARPMAVADQARPVLALAELAGGRIHLVGHSNGGGVATHAALALGARLTSLTLIEPILACLLPEAGEAAAFREFDTLRAQFLADVARGDMNAAAEIFLDFWKPGAWATVPAERRPAVAATMPKIADEFRAVFSDTLSRAAIAGISVPTLLIRGATTTLTARRITDVVLRALPQARFIEIAGAGHMCPLTHAEAVNEAIAAHLAAVLAP